VSRNPLRILLRVRTALVTAARQDLALALAKEVAAERALGAAATTIARERAGCPPDATLAFAVWLPHARAAQDQARALLARQVGQTTQCRAALAERHADAQAVLKLLEKQDAEAALAAGRREQSVMDEAAGRAARPQ
jgi:flagellar export protein FliJ